MRPASVVGFGVAGFPYYSLHLSVQAEESLSELIKKTKPAVVQVISYDAEGKTFSYGSGFFISREAILLPTAPRFWEPQCQSKDHGWEGVSHPVGARRGCDRETGKAPGGSTRNLGAFLVGERGPTGGGRTGPGYGQRPQW